MFLLQVDESHLKKQTQLWWFPNSVKMLIETNARCSKRCSVLAKGKNLGEKFLPGRYSALSRRISHGILLEASVRLQQIVLENKCGPRGSVYNSKEHELQMPAFLPHFPLEPTHRRLPNENKRRQVGRGCHYNNRFSAACAHSLFENAEGMKPTRVFCLERGRFT